MSESRSDERGVGARLRSARERRRMTILQAAERLHVDPHVLEALESDNFAALGAPVYLKGHLRHYAELVGESPEALQNLIAETAAPLPQPDLTRAPKPALQDGGRLAVPAVLVVIVFAVAGSVWWVMSLSHHSAGAAGASSVPPISRAAAQPSAPANAGAHAVARASGTVARRGAPAAVAPPAGEMQLALRFSAPSWVEVYDSAGHRLLYGLATAPSARTLAGRGPLTVLLGNATGVTLEVNGRPASFAQFVRSDHTARFLLPADGRAMPAAARIHGD
jgi:cytoskeleton protein RodZ